MQNFNETESTKVFIKNIAFAAFLKNFYQTFNDVMQRK
jgi:hypothetical protein